jgi:hypothetical protein
MAPIAFEATLEPFDLDVMRIADDEELELADFNVSVNSDLILPEYNDLDDEISLHNQDCGEFKYDFLIDSPMLSPLPALDESFLDFD